MLAKGVKIMFTIKLSLCILYAQAQFNYFDSLYDGGLNVNELVNSQAIVEFDTGIYSVIATTVNPFTVGQLNYFETADDGHRIKELLIENEIPGQHYSTNLIILSDSIAIAASYFIDTTDQQQHSITQFNRQTGEVIWRRYYGSLLRNDYTSHFIKTFDGGYALTGQSVDSVDAQIHLIKTDNLGNQQWENYYGGVGYESSRSLIQTPDSGFMLLGWTQSFGPGQKAFFLIKTDSLGNQQWQAAYGGGDVSVGWGIIHLSDGNYLLTGGFGNGDAKLIKINNSGGVIWQKSYYYQGNSNNFLNWSKELPNGDIISVGAGYTDSEGNSGLLIKIDSEGNVIWQRKYNKNNDTDLFYSIIETSDGGFLLGGQARNVQPFNQDAWLLKVDSVGCPYENCTVGIEEEHINNSDIVIYPNPFNNSFNINYVLEQEAQEVKIEIYDLLGRNLLSKTIDKTSAGNVTINLAECLGVYVLRMYADEKQVYKEKLVCLQK